MIEASLSEMIAHLNEKFEVGESFPYHGICTDNDSIEASGDVTETSASNLAQQL